MLKAHKVWVLFAALEQLGQGGQLLWHHGLARWGDVFAERIRADRRQELMRMDALLRFQRLKRVLQRCAQLRDLMQGQRGLCVGLHGGLDALLQRLDDLDLVDHCAPGRMECPQGPVVRLDVVLNGQKHGVKLDLFCARQRALGMCICFEL